MSRILKMYLSVFALLLCSACSTVNSNVEAIKEFIVSSTPTLTPTSTITPTATTTPEPKLMKIEDALSNCETLSKSQNQVIIEGKIFIPLNQIYGFEGWKGLKLTQFLYTDSTYMTVLIKVGQDLSTMNALPNFFTERDLLIRAYDGQQIYNGFDVALLGRMEFRESSEALRCVLRVEKITTKMPKELSVPLDVEIAAVSKKIDIGSLHLPELTNECTILGGKKQLVRISGSIVDSGSKGSCNMGKCKVLVDDTTGRMYALIPIGESPNSIKLPTNEPGSGGLIIYDSNGNPVNKWKISLIGVFHSVGLDCSLDVYKIE